MNLSLTKYQQTIDALSLEARIIILATALGIIFITWYYWLWQTQHSNISKINTSIRMLESKEIPLLNTQLKIAEETVRTQCEQEAKIKTKNTQARLISMQKANKILQDLLTTRYHLVLLQFQNVPPKTGSLERDIIIKLQGSYFSVMNYLQAIEKLEWRVFWDRLEYNVIQYPIAEVTLQIHTFNSQGDWLNV